jgi:hypothetical protein
MSDIVRIAPVPPVVGGIAVARLLCLPIGRPFRFVGRSPGFVMGSGWGSYCHSMGAGLRRRRPVRLRRLGLRKSRATL